MSLPDAQPQTDTSIEERSRVTIVALSFGVLVVTCAAASYLELKTSSAHLAMSNLPLVVLIPFLIALTLNVLLKRFLPRLSLSSRELRLLLSVLWVGGSFAGYNWATQWVGTMVAPRYYASPENRWVEILFDHLPWWMYPTNLPGVEEQFYLGASDPGLLWPAWITPLFWASAAGLGMMSIGVGVTAIFQRQWTDHERLNYPLAEVPLALTAGFDRARGWAPFLNSRVFWIGFAIASFPLLWNIIEYFIPAFPRIPVWDAYWRPSGPRAIMIRYLRGFSYRLLPTVMGFTFLCDLNILFSIWSLYLVGMAFQYGMSRVGFSVGLAGQEANPTKIVGLFSHGVMIGLVVWSIWTARGHLRRIWHQARKGESGSTVFLSPRAALLTTAAGVTFMVFWLYAAGVVLWLAFLWVVLFWASILLVMKFLAASGFAYLFPKFGTTATSPNPMGVSEIPTMWTGTTGMSETSLVGTGVVGWRLLSGWRLPPALPHVERLIGPKRAVTRLITLATLTGILAGACYTIHLCYEEGAAAFNAWSLLGAPRGLYNGIATNVTEPRTVPDPEKIFVWLFGVGAAGAITLAQSRISWWPWHPIGLLTTFDSPVRVNAMSIFIVWLAKVIVLRLGGIGLYRKAKPCAYGLIVGFVFAVAVACTVDLIWFPDGGHYVHGY